MHSKNAGLCGLLLAGAALAIPGVAAAHPVTVDGNPAEWMTRLPNAENLGIVARDATGKGELIWRDAAGDTRTDVSSPEDVADVIALQTTGDANGVGFLLRRKPGVNLAGAPIQVQIAIDTDRVDGSGQEFFAEFADTKVASHARWERLVETLFGSGSSAKVIDASFNMVANAQAVQGASGDVEIFVPWSALGLNGPPAAPLRFTVATFRAQNNDLTVDVGGSMISNVLDAITDYGDPAAAMYPNTWVDVQDQIVDYSFDVYFSANGEVYAPLVAQRFLASSSGGGADEWYAVKNVTPAAISLAGFKLGDEETPDGNEGMFNFPVAATLPAGASFTVARAGAAYQTFFGAAPDAELPPGASMAVPDMIAFTPWTSGAAGTMSLTNAGDELLVLDPSNVVIDVAVFGTGAYPGITSFTPAPAIDDVLTRSAASSDTDSCLADFSNAGKTCTADAQCGGACFQCAGNACSPKPQGAACPDANPCNGDEICDGMGACVSNPAPACDDNNPCTVDGCTPATGCTHNAVPDNTGCNDATVCNGQETCIGGACVAGTALDCDDSDPCTIDACDAMTGCSNTDAPVGADCSDGDACNGAESCDAAGACVSGPPADCDDQNPCTSDSCDMVAGCKHTDAADNTPCADADECNGAEICVAGTCTAGTALDCDDTNDCTVDSCDAATGCAHANAAQGAACDDGDMCTSPDACDGNGACVPGAGGCGGTGGTTGGSGGMTGGSGGTTTTSSTTGEGASGGEGGSGGGGGDGIDEGGCGCRVAGGEDRTSGLAALAGLALAASFVRRRRGKDGRG